MDHESPETVRESVKILAHFWILQNESGFWTMNRPKQFANVSKSGPIFGSSKTDQFLDHESSQTVRERVKIRTHFWILQKPKNFTQKPKALSVSPHAVVKASTVVLSVTPDGRTDRQTDGLTTISEASTQ